MESWWEIWDVWIVEVNVYVFLTGMKSSVGDVEDEMIWIWSDDGGVSNWHGLDVVDGSAGVESEVSWISVWTSTMLVTPVAGSTELEGLDPFVRMEVAVEEEDWELAVMVRQQALWPVELELVEWVAVGKVVALESSPGMTAGVLW